MPTTDLTVTQKPSQYAKSGTVVTWNTADNVNGNSFTVTGRETLILRNPSGAPISVTITSAADPEGRTGDFVHAVPATSDVVTQRFSQQGWQGAGGKITVTSASASLLIAVIRDTQ